MQIIETHTAQEFKKLHIASGSIFLSPEWISLYDAKAKVFSITDNGGKLIGGFILNVSKKIGFTLVCDLQYTPSCQLFLKSEAQSIVSKNQDNKDVTALIVETLSRYHKGLIDFSLPVEWKDTHKFSWAGYTVSVAHTYIINLSESGEVLYNKLSSNRRKNLKKAEKDGIRIELNENKEDLFKLILQTFKRQNEKVNQTLLKKIIFDFANEKNSFFYIAYNSKQKAIACTFCLYDEHSAYYLFGGYDDVNAHDGAGPLCMWNSILHAKKINLPQFDFEGSMIPAVEKYFREFGGDLKSYSRISKSSLSIELLRKIKLGLRI